MLPKVTQSSFFASALFGLAAVTIWAASPVLIKMSLEGLSLLELFLVRYTLSFLITLPVLWRLIQRLNSKVLASLFPVAVLISVHISLQAFSLTILDAGWYAVIFAFAPVITLVIFKFHFTLEAIVTYAVMLIGAGLFIDFSKLYNSEISIVAFLAAIGTTLAWVFYTKAIAEVQDDLSNWDVAAINNTALFLLSLGATAFFPIELDFLTKSLDVLFPALILAASVPIGYALFSAALRAVPIFTISVQNIELGITVCLGAIFLGETFETTDFLALLLITAGLYRVSRFKEPKR